MKKTLVAIAALAAFGAQAQSSVQITGSVDAGYKAVSNNKNDTAKWSGIAGNNVSTSNITVKGVQDIGGGTSASFLYEIDPTVDRSTTLNQAATNLGQSYSGSSAVNGEQYVGLAGKLGDLKLGTPNSPALTAGTTSTPFGTALGGGWSAGFGRLGTATVSGLNQYVGGPSSGGRIIRSEKAAVYTTPSFSGFSGQVEYSAKNANSGTTTSNDIGLLGLAAKYNNGPLNAMYYSGKATAGQVTAAGTGSAYGTAAANSLAANTSVKWNIFGANYTMGAATLYVGATTTKGSVATDEDSKSSNVAVKYAVNGNVDLMANYLTRTSKLAAQDTSAIGPKTKLLGLGADYKLSKTATLYARYERITDANVAAVAAASPIAAVTAAKGATQNTTAVGIKVSF